MPRAPPDLPLSSASPISGQHRHLAMPGHQALFSNFFLHHIPTSCEVLWVWAPLTPCNLCLPLPPGRHLPTEAASFHGSRGLLSWSPRLMVFLVSPSNSPSAPQPGNLFSNKTLPCSKPTNGSHWPRWGCGEDDHSAVWRHAEKYKHFN